MMLRLFGSLLALGLCVACGDPLAKSISDEEFLGVAYAGEVPGAARVVWKRRLLPEATAGKTEALAFGAFPGTIGVIAAGGRDRLVILRDSAAGGRERIALSLEFAAPRRNSNRVAGAESVAPPDGLRLLRKLFRGDIDAGLRTVNLVQARGPGGLQPLLLLEYARDSGAAFFLYRAEKETGSLERVYDSQLSPAPGQPGEFLYYNGFEIQSCLPARGVCPALVFVRESSSRGLAHKSGDSHAACSGVSRLAMRLENLAPRPASFALSLAFLDSAGAGDSRVAFIPASPSTPACSTAKTGEFRCRISGPRAVDLCFERRPADGGVDAAGSSGFMRIRAGSGKGAARSALPPANSLRRTLDAPGGPAYLVSAWSASRP